MDESGGKQMKVDESGKSRFKGMKEEESRCKQKKGIKGV